MNFLLDLPHEARLAVLFVLGILVGGQLNRGIYRLAWNRRRIGPFSPPDPEAPPRRWFDRIPVLGWFGLRRESALHGKGFWIRPMLIELLTGAGFAALYWWEMSGSIIPTVAAPHVLTPPPDTILHAHVFAHLILISLMIVATFIDIDEKTIPDAITVPGMLIALLLATAIPTSLLPIPMNIAGIIFMKPMSRRQ